MTLSNLEGQILNERYQVRTLIGQGGMAAVYKAYDPNLHRAVAIKIIHPHLSNNAEFFRRFEEEATGVAHLRHPNIVQMYDFNHDGDLYYMVMEYIAGETLQTRLKRLNDSRRRLDVKDAVRFAAEICDAAEYAHERGMIHRDIKPANVMLDVHGKAILMDFGIARIVGVVEHTATGAVLGTAMYMAPEQIQGLHADARADIYSLGVTLYEMLSGRPPFEADSAMTLMMMHLNDPVPDIRDLQPQAPPEMVALIGKAMAKDRNQRFQSAAQLAAALRGLDSSPRAAAPASVAAPAAGVDATHIEAPILAGVAATMLETAPSSAAASFGAAQAAGATFIEKPITAPQPAVRQSPAAFPSAPEQSAYPVQAKRGKTGLLALLALVIVLGVGGFFAYQKFMGKGAPPLAAAPPAATTQVAAVEPTQASPAPAEPAVAPSEPAALLPAAVVSAPTQTSEPAAIAEPPSPTPTETAQPIPAPLVIGGADKIAFISAANIWAANLDGSELTQLTSDGSQKNSLRWLPDGQGLSYISGKCIHTVSLAAEDTTITCFNNSDSLKAFEPSRDGTQAAISLDNQLYLIPFDLEGLKSANSHGDLAAMATCADLAPYQRNFGTGVRWSKDDRQWAALVMGVLKDGRRGDIVQVFSVDRCIPNPMVKAQFPEPHFSFKAYTSNPVIESYDWDGESLFVLNDFKRNDGFGDLHIFNLETFKPLLTINPVKGACCYRDVHWSPDGTQLVFAFQNVAQGSSSTTQLYLIPYGEIGAGGSFEPLPLPEISDPKEKPQPVLRPAVTP